MYKNPDRYWYTYLRFYKVYDSCSSSSLDCRTIHPNLRRSCIARVDCTYRVCNRDNEYIGHTFALANRCGTCIRSVGCNSPFARGIQVSKRVWSNNHPSNRSNRFDRHSNCRCNVRTCRLSADKVWRSSIHNNSHRR